MLAMVAKYDLELEQLNVKTTLLHRNVEKKIYVKEHEDLCS